MMSTMLFLFLVTSVAIYMSIKIWQKTFFKIISIIIAPFIRWKVRNLVSSGLADSERYREHFGIPSKKRPIDSDLVWVHAASVGEVVSCIPFINMFKKLHPDVTILITTTTMTSRDIVNERLKDLVIHQFTPFDVITWVRRFVKYWKPKAAFFIESDIYPNALFYLYEKDIPIYLLNTRISQKSLKRMLLVKKIFNILPYRLFREVFVPSEEVRSYVRELGASGVTIIPNLKILSDKLPCKINDASVIKEMINNRKTWFAASTHLGEEDIILNIHKRLREKYKDILTVIAIRHPNRVAELINLCDENGLTYSLHTSDFSNEKPITTDIYIVDVIGAMGMFFENIDTVFVGGSLIPGIGGHNILEPINFRCNVVTGQYTENFRDIYDYVKAYCKKVNDQAELFDFVSDSIETYNKKLNKLDIEKYKELWEKMVRRISREVFRI